MSGKEQDFIKEAFDTNWVVPLGPNVNAFEKSLQDFLIENGKLKIENEGKQVVALSAGTAALHLGLILLGVQAGDEVICQSFTFCASANPVTYLGATAVFVDSEEDTWNMNPVLLEEAIRDRIAKPDGSRKRLSRCICTGCRQRWTRFVLWPRNMGSPCWRMPQRRWDRNIRSRNAVLSGSSGR